jgi:hypothetical protein
MAELIALGMVKTGEDIAMGNPQPSPKHDIPSKVSLFTARSCECLAWMLSTE